MESPGYRYQLPETDEEPLQGLAAYPTIFSYPKVVRVESGVALCT